MIRKQIGEALEYTEPRKGIAKIHERHSNIRAIFRGRRIDDTPRRNSANFHLLPQRSLRNLPQDVHLHILEEIV